jgi:hypothetical protein
MFSSAFAAGISVGRLMERSARPVPPPIFLLNALNLTADQQAKVHVIWADVAKTRATNHCNREQLRSQRDDEIRATLSEDQKKQFTEIQNRYNARQDATNQSWQRAEDDAIEQTKQILNEEQRQTFETLLKERAEFKKKEKAEHSSSDSTPKAP